MREQVATSWVAFGLRFPCTYQHTSVNVYTKKSQWDKPTEPAYPHGEAPDHPPPSYAPPSDGQRLSSEKSRLGTNNPYAGAGGGSGQNISDDEKLARQLQEEEEARARGQHHGAADNFYSQGSGAPQAGQYGYGQQNPYGAQDQGYGASGADTQDKGKSKGLLGKLLGKASGHSSRPPQQHGYGGYGGQPMQGGYGGYGGQPGYGYPQQGMYGQPPRRTGGGMGAGGAAALGLGGGLLGGALIGEAMGDAGDGGDGGGDYGGGDGGGDFGGGDMGGDMGGGDMGGGDF